MRCPRHHSERPIPGTGGDKQFRAAMSLIIESRAEVGEPCQRIVDFLWFAGKQSPLASSTNFHPRIRTRFAARLGFLRPHSAHSLVFWGNNFHWILWWRHLSKSTNPFHGSCAMLSNLLRDAQQQKRVHNSFICPLRYHSKLYRDVIPWRYSRGQRQ